MANFNWDNIQSERFCFTGIVNRANADKLFISLLMELEKRNIDAHKTFAIGEIASLIPIGTADINNYSTYGYSFMSMLGGQKYRDYFVFECSSLKDELTLYCNNPQRDNYYWQNNYLNEKLRIDPKYIKC